MMEPTLLEKYTEEEICKLKKDIIHYRREGPRDRDPGLDIVFRALDSLRARKLEEIVNRAEL